MRTVCLPIALCLFSSLGCVAADVNVSLDLDGDGLLADIEEALGTDPDDPDSDGDEWSDGDEYEQNTDPLDADSKPYTGGWKIDACHDNVNSTGFGLGDVIENLTAKDQFEETIELHHFCNKVVALIGASET